MSTCLQRPARRRYETDREFGDRFIPAFKQIIASLPIDKLPCKINVTSAKVDMEQAADLVIMNAGVTIACRIRRPGFLVRYHRQFTIRACTCAGNKTENHKFREGWCRWLLYCHAKSRDSTDMAKWWLLDLKVWRDAYIDGRGKMNEDRSEFFYHIIDEYPPELVIAEGP